MAATMRLPLQTRSGLSGGIMQMDQTQLLTLNFNRGAFVRWFQFNESEGMRISYGIVECEATNRPGYYYVRSECGLLHLVFWQDLKLAARA